MTAVKVCGLTRSEDVALACAAGASLLGFNFSAQSPRRITPDAARKLTDVAAPGVLRVGVFVGEEPTLVREAVDAARLDLVQIHRPLRGEDVDESPMPVIAVARVGPEGGEVPSPELLARCHAILFDTLDASRSGGTGRVFDWSIIGSQAFGLPVLLAGGLDAGNVGEAVQRVRPWAVDVASGVEQSPGLKDPERLRRFFDAVRRADGASA